MKKAFLALFAGLLLFTSCDKLNKLTQFTLTDQFETTIKAGLATALPTDVDTPPVSSNAEKELTTNNSRVDMVQSVKMQSLQLLLTAPSGRKFDFLKDIELFISADGLPEKRIAYDMAIPDTVDNVLVLKCENPDLEAYIKKLTYRVRMRVTTDKILNENINVRVVSTYLVDAKILGI
jgi:hypothetical protein